MSEDFPFGIVLGIVLGMLWSALVWSDYVYDFNIETAQKACAPYGGIHRIEARVFEEQKIGVGTIVLCKDGTKVRRSNEP